MHNFSKMLLYSSFTVYATVKKMAVGNRNLRMETCIINAHMRPLDDIQLV